MTAVAHGPVPLCDRPSRYRYQIGCRCPGCRAENAEYSRIWRSNTDRRWRSYGS